jgi:hypothetical protein
MQETDWLGCQGCGETIKRDLTPAQVQQVAANPYKFIGFCTECKKDPSIWMEDEFRG